MNAAHLNEQLRREVERLFAEIELDYLRQKAARTEAYTPPFGHLARLLAVALPTVSEDVGEFTKALASFLESLPEEHLTRRVLMAISDPAINPEVGTLQLYRDARWQSFGCPAINIESRLAASLMLSECPEEMLEDVVPPWGAFVIRLPAGLIEQDDISYTHLIVNRYVSPPPPPIEEGLPEDVQRALKKMSAFMELRQGVKWGLYGMSGESGHVQGEAKLSEHLGKAPRVFLMEPEMPLGHPGERLLAVFARLAIGVCLLCQSEGALRRRSTKKKERGPSRMGKGPVTTEYVLGQKVTVGFDCVDAVREYVRGEVRSLPAIQWIVRGHWRNQPIGPGRTERKRIWIMPHWKGPQEAPKLFREYEFKPSLAAPPTEDEA